MAHLEAIVKRNEGEVVLSAAHYEKLKSAADTLAKLQAAGVDNWEGYSEAFREDDEEDDD